MIHPNYAKALLNALFQTDGAAGLNKSEEKEQLIDQGIDKSVFSGGITATMKLAAYINADFTEPNDTTRMWDDWKSKINASSWYYTEDTPSEYLTYKEDGTERHRYFSGWRVVTRLTQQNKYPDNVYLALFTTMPDGNGTGYVEPTVDSNGASTTYMRANLYEAIVTGNVCINNAVTSTVVDAETGEESAVALLNNREAIMYPEVVDVDWGAIVGFGVFEKDTAMGGDIPIFWGKLNDPISATVGHVPLFRLGDFEVTLQ